MAPTRFFGLLFVLLLAAGVVVAVIWALLVSIGSGSVWPPPKATDSQWSTFAMLLQGIGAVVLSFAALVGGGWALHRYLDDRGQERIARERQSDLDVAGLQRDVIASLQLLHRAATEPVVKAARLEQLERAVDRHCAVIDGLLRLRPDLAASLRDTIAVRLQALKDDLQPRDPSGPWSDSRV